MRHTIKARYGLLIVMILFTAASCASVPKDAAGIRERLNAINTGDGVDKNEALVIAQNFMLDNGFDYDWDVTKPRNDKESDNGAFWSIAFDPLEDGWGSGRRKISEVTFEQMMTFFVKVNKNTGEAIGSKTIISEGS